jgi:hypothetical protein
MTYAANLGRNRIIQMLHTLGAGDLQSALGRAVLLGKIATARMFHEMLGSPKPPDGALAGAADTLSVSGTAFGFGKPKLMSVRALSHQASVSLCTRVFLAPVREIGRGLEDYHEGVFARARFMC